MVDCDGMGVIEHAQRQRCDQVAQNAVEPSGPFRLPGPEVPVGIGRNLFPLHHLSRAPDIVPDRGVEFAHDRAVHVTVVSDDDTGFIGQILCSLQLILRREEPYQPPDHPENPRCFFIVQQFQIHFFIPRSPVKKQPAAETAGCIISPKSKPEINKLLTSLYRPCQQHFSPRSQTSFRFSSASQMTKSACFPTAMEPTRSAQPSCMAGWIVADRMASSRGIPKRTAFCMH